MDTTCLYTGLDLHKRSITATTLDEAGSIVAHSKLPCLREALLLYFADCAPGPVRHRAAVEATTGWYWVSDALADTDVDLCLAHAKGVKAIVSAKVKTDSADARMLAQLLRTNLLPEAHMAGQPCGQAVSCDGKCEGEEDCCNQGASQGWTCLGC